MDAAIGNLTEQQRTAIFHRGDSIALSAGAGCGKTFVLTQRFLSHLEADVPLGRLAAITFTERAAREMRDRIRDRCRERLAAAADDAERGRWLQIERELHTARVHTIHAFCAALLRAHAVEAGLDPGFQVLDEAQSQTLLAEAMDDELRRQLAEQRGEILDLAAAFDLNHLRKLLREMLYQRQRIDFAAWRDRTAEEVLHFWQQHYETTILPHQRATVLENPAVMQLQRTLRDHVPTNSKMRERRERVLAGLAALATTTDVCEVLDDLRENARVQHAGGAKAWDSPNVYEQVKTGAEDLRKLIDKALPDLSFDLSAALPAAEMGLKLLRLTEAVADRFADRKRELSALDFDDLLIQTRDLLVAGTPSAPAAELAGRLSEHLHTLLVDEFQDTDPLQVDLVKALCGSGLQTGKLFFVGDFKQSIYRFRRADPQVFRALQLQVPAAGRIPLTKNFRSQPSILAFVNALFFEAIGEDYEPLVPHRPQTTDGPCIEFLWAPAGEDAKKETADAQRRREAEWIARRIRQMLVDQEQRVVEEHEDGPAARPVKKGDVAILFRALSDVHHYEDALRRYGIEYYLVGGHAFYAQQEIFDVLNLLSCLADEGDELALAGVLRSPWFNLADETLFWLANERGGLARGLFNGAAIVQLDEEQAQRARFAAAALRQLRERKDRLPVAILLQEALRVTGYDALLAAEFLGERKLANLRKLIDQARAFDESGLFTLSDFITQLSEFVADAPREPLAAAHAEDADVVRLMTIHQAKGLEFPVVFVPDLARPKRGTYHAAAFHEELGPLVKERDSEATTALDWFNHQEGAQDDQEQTRLFYVAVTRAADYLVLSSGVKEIGQAGTPWLKLLAERFDLETGTMQGELPQGWEVPEVAVVSTMPRAVEQGDKQRRRALPAAIEDAKRRLRAEPPALPAGVAPLKVDAAARREFSFSRLSGALKLVRLEDETADAEPAWRKPADVDPIGLGTLVHAVLEVIDFSPAGIAQIEPLVRRFAELHLPRQQGDPRQAIDMLRRLLRSPRAAQLAAAKTMHRELEFLLAWPPGEESTIRAPGGTYLRGFIDCLYEDADGQWHILDYKTNDIAASAAARDARQYEPQLLIYALAARQVLGRAPAEIALHFLRPGVEQALEFSEQAAQDAVARVNQALAAYVEQA